MDIGFTIDRINGYEKATDFSFSVSPTPLSAVTEVKWIFGDGTESKIFDPIHSYLHEGIYNPTVLVFTTTTTFSATTAIYVKPYIDESIYFDFVPPPAFAGHYNRYPFRLHITSKITDPHFIDLSAMFSRSYKHQEFQTKWGFLRPEWRFTDLNGNVLDKIQTTDDLLIIDGDGNLDSTGTVVGVSGVAEFYFIDDLYNFDLAISGLPFTTILATLETDKVPAKSDYLKTQTNLAGFANSKTTAFFPYVIESRPPEMLKITENGIAYHVNPKWSDIKTPLIVSPSITENFPDEWIDGIGISRLYQPIEFFIKGEPIDNRIIPLTINVSNLSALFDPYDTKFSLYDDTGYKVSGYYKGSFTTDTISAQNCVISASAYATVPNLSGIYSFPILYVSNPEAKTLHNIHYFSQPNLSAAYYEKLFNSVDTLGWDRYQINTFDVPLVEPSDYTNLALAVTGFHGVYSMAVTPFPDYHVWAADSEKNWIYRYATTGEMLCSINLRTVVTENNLGYLVDQQVSPACIVLDSQKNLWVTLYDTVSTLKFDSIGNFVCAIHPLASTGYTIPPNINPIWFENTQYYPSSSTETGDNNFIEPTGIDSDMDDNIWVSYSYFASGVLVKYDNTGNLLTTITFPTCSCPQEVVCDKNNEVWILHSDLIWGDLGKIEKRDSMGVLLSSFGNIRQPNHATLDPKQNLWFTFDYDKVGRISNSDSSIMVINLSSRDVLPFIPDYWFYKDENTDESVFTGISTDYRGNVYVINTIENQIYILDQETMAYKDRFFVNPQGVSYFIEESFLETEEDYHYLVQSLQAQGDWSGFRWINKYGPTMLYHYNTTSSIFVSGSTIDLNYYKEDPYSVYKINEDFSLTEHMKSVAFMPVLRDSEYLFDTFLHAAYGNGDFEDFGVKSYEKTANFLGNQTDIDTCNIDQLYDLSQMVDLNSDDFKLSYPEAIKRLVNLASINESLLWGNSTNLELDVPKLISESRPINTTTFMVTAGIPMVLKTKSLGTYRIIQTGPIYDQNIYSIQYLVTSLGLDSRDWRSEHEFFVADAWKAVDYTNNIIDWNNSKTNISPILSTAQIDWSTDQGVLETMISYNLFKGLDFLP